MATDAYARAPAHDHSAPRRAPPRARDGTPRQGARPRGPRWRRGALALDARQERVQRVIGGWRRCRGRGGRGVVVDGDGGEGGATRVERRTSRGGWGAERTRATGGTSTDAVADARGRAGAREREERRRRHPRARDDVRRPERGPVRRAEPRARWFCPRTRVDLVCGRLDDASSRRYRHRASRHAVVSLQSAVRRLARRRGASARSRAAHARARLVRLDRSHPRDARRLARAPRRFFGRSPRARAPRVRLVPGDASDDPPRVPRLVRAAPSRRRVQLPPRELRRALRPRRARLRRRRIHPDARVRRVAPRRARRVDPLQALGGADFADPRHVAPPPEPSSPSRRTPPPPRRATPATPSDTPAPPQNRPRRRTSPSRPRAASSKSKRTSSCTG